MTAIGSKNPSIKKRRGSTGKFNQKKAIIRPQGGSIFNANGGSLLTAN